MIAALLQDLGSHGPQRLVGRMSFVVPHHHRRLAPTDDVRNLQLRLSTATRKLRPSLGGEFT